MYPKINNKLNHKINNRNMTDASKYIYRPKCDKTKMND